MKRQSPSRRKRKKGDTARLAARLAPLEELETGGNAKQVGSSTGSKDPQSNNHHGTIVVDSSNLNIPEDIIEGSGDRKFLGMEPVVLVILGIMLAFIAFIAWQISQMPSP